MCVYLKTDNKLTSMTKSMTMQSESVSVSAILNTSFAVLLFAIFIFRQFYIVTCLILSVKSFTMCPTFHTVSDIGDGLIFRFSPQKRRMKAKFFIHHYLYTEVSLLSFSKREFHLAACAFAKTASFHTQLSTYSRCFITSGEHGNSGEHEISDLSTDLSLSTVYNFGPRRLRRDQIEVLKIVKD